MIITIELFNRLDERLQIDLARVHPVIGRRETKCYKYLLCQVQSFYVEFQIYRPIIKKDLVKYKAFESVDRIRDYLMKIDSSGLIDG